MLNSTRWDPPRRLFIDALNSEAPQVAKSLFDLWDLYQGLDYIREHTSNWPSLTAACQQHELKEVLEPLRDGVKSWAERYRLDEPFWEVDPQWMLNTALYTFEWAERHPPFREQAELLSIWSIPPAQLEIENDEQLYIQGEDDVFFIVMKFDPTIFSLADYEKYVAHRVAEAYKHYLKQAENELERQKWMKVPAVEAYYVYGWLVQHHVFEKSFQQITADWVESGEWHVQVREGPERNVPAFEKSFQQIMADWVESGEWHVQVREDPERNVPAEEWIEMGGSDIEDRVVRKAVIHVAEAVRLYTPKRGRGRPKGESKKS